MPVENVIQFSGHQPKTKSSPTPQNEVNFPLHGECGELAKGPANMGLQATPDTPPLANWVEPADDVSGVNSKTNVLPPKTKVKAKAKAKPDFLHLRTPGPDGYKLDCAKMLFTELKTAYPWEFNSWRGNKNKCNNPAGSKKKFAWEPWPAEWNEFKDFLLDMEPKPSPEHTLERLNNSLRKYGPGLCVWTLPDAQNNNKSDNVLLVDPLDGKVWTPKKIANATGVAENAVRKRIKLSWTLYELLENKKSKFLRDKWLQADALPKAPPKGPKKVLRPIEQVPSLQRCLDLCPIDDDHYEGETRIKNFPEICDEYDAFIDWVDDFNAGLPVPQHPPVKYLKVRVAPDRVALRFTPKPPEPAPTYSSKHDPADCMPDHDDD
jgi:hypothetical protein